MDDSRATGQPIPQIRDADKEVYGVLLEEHRPLVLGFLRRYLDSHQESDVLDVYQDIMYRVLEALSSGRGPESAEGFRRWVIAIANNYLIDRSRRITAAKRDWRRNSGDAALEAVAAHGPTASRVARGKEEVLRVMAKMSPSEVVISTMKAQGYKAAEIAEVLGWRSAGAVDTKYNRMRGRLA